MNHRIVLALVVGVLLLVGILFFFTPNLILWPTLLAGLILGAAVFAREATEAKPASPPISQPPAEPEQPAAPEQAPYAQGYQVQMPGSPASASWPFSAGLPRSDQPKQDPAGASYDQPQVQYPEPPLPMQ